MWSDALQTGLYLAKYSLLKRGARRAFQELLVQECLSPDELEAPHWRRLTALPRAADEGQPGRGRTRELVGRPSGRCIAGRQGPLSVERGAGARTGHGIRRQCRRSGSGLTGQSGEDYIR